MEEEFQWYVVSLVDPETLQTMNKEYYTEDSNDAWGEAMHEYPEWDVKTVHRK